MPDPTPVLTDEQREELLSAAYAYAHPRNYGDPRSEWHRLDEVVASMVAEAVATAQGDLRKSLADFEDRAFNHGYERGRDEVSALLEAVLAECERRIGREPDRVLEFWVQRVRAALTDPAAAVARVRAEAWDEALRWVRAQADVTSPEYAIDRIDRAEPFNPYRADRIGGDA